MAVIVDATGTKLITTVAGASVNYTGITVGSGANRALVVTVACGAAVTAPNAHWDTAGTNQAMTLISAVETQTNVTTFMFGLRNPTAGLKTLNVAWTTSAVSNIEAISFTGAETTSDAKAFINANFATNAATVASIAIGLTSPADSIAVASYATSATFSSITQTNIFTDTTNTGCEGAASRANGAGANIVFTGSDTGTTGNKVMVGFVVAPPPPVLSQPWQDPVLRKPADITKAQRGKLFVPFFQVWYPPFRWDDFTRRKQPPLDTQPLAWSTFTPATTPVGWNDPLEQPVRNWRRSSIYSAPFLALGVPPAQVFFPYDRWPDTAPAAKRVAQNPDWSYGSFVTPASVPTYTQWTQWADFAPKPKSAVNFQPWAFIPTPQQVFFPYAPWDDFTRRKPQYLDTQPSAFVFTPPAAVQVWFPPGNWPDLVLPPAGQAQKAMRGRLSAGFSQIWYPPGNWPDSVPARRRPVEFAQPAFVPVIVTAPAPTMAWTNWPDFAPSAKRPVDPQSFAFMALTPSATVVQDWPDYLAWKKPPLNYNPLALAPNTPAAAVVQWDAWTNWPDLVPTRPRRTVDFQPWTFIPSPRQVFFPYAPWDDFVKRKQPPLDTQPSAWSTFTPLQVVTYFASPWPDFAPKPKQLVDIRPWTFIPTPGQVFFPYAPWDDFTRRKRPLNYDPLTFVQTIRTPWDTMTTWPDFAPIRGRLGLSAVQQQFTARFPGVITATTVTITMSAFEINADGALMAISVIQSLPATNAAVSIHEVGILGGSITP